MKRFRLADLPMIVKLGFAPAFALAMLALLAGGMIVIERSQSADLNTIAHAEMPRSLRLASVSERINTVHGQLYFLLTHQAAAIDKAKIPDQMQALLAEIDSIGKEVQSIQQSSSPAQQPALAQLVKDLKECRESVDVVGAMIGADFQTAAGFVAPFEQNYGRMSATVAKIVADAQRAMTEEADASYGRAETSGQVVLVAAVLTLLAVGGIAASSVLTTRRAILRIAGATERLAKGDNGVDLDGLARGDELGAIVRSLVVFRDDQRHLAQLRIEQESQREAAERERREADARAEAAQRQQSEVVSALANGLDHLASGDLTYRLEQDFPGEYRKLHDDFNATIARLEETLRNILETTGGIHSGTREISQASDDLSRRTEHQAATLEETAAALDQITVTVRKTADGAAHARQFVATATSDAERSGQIVRNAVSAMNEIEGSSRQIAQIIGVIDEIAFQTNLLALNAGVEAARAGDAGRGFAVVASEVRALAQRSADAAKQIKTLIAASTSQVDAGVGLVGETGKALERIIAQIAEIKTVVTEIATSAEEQSTGLHQVNAAMNQMDTVTQQNAAMVEEATAASHSLAHEADELVALIDGFQVSGVEQQLGRKPVAPTAASAPVSATVAAPTLSQAPRREAEIHRLAEHAPVKPAKAVKKPAVRREPSRPEPAAAPKRRAAAAQASSAVEEGWEEF